MSKLIAKAGLCWKSHKYGDNLVQLPFLRLLNLPLHLTLLSPQLHKCLLQHPTPNRLARKQNHHPHHPILPPLSPSSSHLISTIPFPSFLYTLNSPSLRLRDSARDPPSTHCKCARALRAASVLLSGRKRWAIALLLTAMMACARCAMQVRLQRGCAGC